MTTGRDHESEQEGQAETLAEGAGAEEIALDQTLVDDAAGSPASSGARGTPVRTSDLGEPMAVTLEHEGRYDRTAQRELGRGGIGRVMAAHDTHLGREVAIKELIAPDPKGSKGRSVYTSARFLREARVTGQLEHPNIVPVYELGERADGTIYYSMKVVRGRSMAQVLRGAASLETRLALLDHFQDACEAIAYAHSRGVIHRDLKPDNIMVGEFGETMVLDWGLAKVQGTEDLNTGDLKRQLSLLQAGASGQTVDGAVLGTPNYMSPEQANGEVETIDERSDVWSLGAILYELLTGRPPFVAPDPMVVVAKVMTERPLPVRHYCSDAPAELSAIAERALSESPVDRYQSAAELAAEVVAFQEGRRVGAYEYSSWDLLLRFVRRNRAASLAALVLVLGSLAASAVIYQSLLEEEAARAVAERESARARESERRARQRHAETLLVNAERALVEQDSVAAAVYAAAALERVPRDLGPPSEGEPSEEQGWLVRATSALLQAEGQRDHQFDTVLRRPDGEPILSPTLSPDGHQLAAIIGEELAIYSLEGSDRQPRTFPRRARAVGGFSPDGRLLALLDGPDAGLYKVADGSLQRALPPRAKAIAFCGGKVYLGGDDGEVLIEGVLGEAPPEHLQTGLARVTLLDVAPGCERLAVATKYGSRLVISDLVEGREVRALRLSSAAWSLAFSPDGERLAVGGEEPRIWLIPVSASLPIDSVSARGWVHAVAWNEGRLVSTESSYDLVFRDPRTGRVLEVLHRPYQGASTLSVASNGLVVASSSSARMVALWRRTKNRQLSSRAFEGTVRHLDASADGERLVVATPGDVWVLRLGAGELADAEAWQVALPGDYGPPAGVAAAPGADGFALITNLGRVVLGHAGEGKAPPTLREIAPPWRGHSYPLQAVTFSPDGQILFAGARSGEIRRWAISTEAPLEPLRGHRGKILGLEVSPDGRRLASASADGTVRLWDLERGEALSVLSGHEQLASDACFSPEGDQLLTVDGGGWLRFWSVDTGRSLRAFQGHQVWINRCGWSSRGGVLATASDDTSVRLWSAASGRLLRILPVDGLAISVDFSSEGRFVFYHRYEESRRLVRAEVDTDVLGDDPVALLRRAERLGAVRLVGGELVPAEL